MANDEEGALKLLAGAGHVPLITVADCCCEVKVPFDCWAGVWPVEGLAADVPDSGEPLSIVVRMEYSRFVASAGGKVYDGPGVYENIGSDQMIWPQGGQ